MKLVRAKEGYRKVGDKYLLAKKCTKCGKWLATNSVNFCRAKNGRYGLNSKCKECERKRKKQWREENPEYDKQYRQDNKNKIAEQQKQYYEDNKEMIIERVKQYREANRDKIAKRKKRYYEANKEKILEQCKQYRENNKDKKAEYDKQYYEANKEKIAKYRENNKDKKAEYNKQYYKANKEKEAERHKRYRQTPQGQASQFNARNKRRHKKEAQGTGATGEQWIEMMQYFDWRCAYTGKRLTKKTRSTDHIVPIDAGGDDMVWNMVPMLRNLNSSKCAKDMLEWYREQSFYSETRLAKIYEWQEYAYNKWGKDTEYFNTNDIQITLL